MDGSHALMTFRIPLVLVVALAVSAACAAPRPVFVPPGTAQADQYLFEQGEASMEARRWSNAREYFRQIVDNYPQSPYRPDAKLGIGDAYLGERGIESLMLAVTEFREFLTFFPTNPRADYAQYRLAVAYSHQMLAPERDQTATHDTIRELEVFVERYPNSTLMGEARTLLREARDRLSEASYRVGLYYFRARWYPGAIDRFRAVLDKDPDFTRRDAVYYHLAESLVRVERPEEALPYYERLVSEFEQSSHLDQARRRISELKNSPVTP
jgi:outer membrane protein assembly factor BamD